MAYSGRPAKRGAKENITRNRFATDAANINASVDASVKNDENTGDNSSGRGGRRLGITTAGVLALMGAFSCVNRDERGAATGRSLSHSSNHSLRPAPRLHSPAALPAIPPDVRSFVRQATEAVNARDLNALTPLATSAALPTLNWIQSKTTKHWNGDVLAMPVLSRSASASNEKTSVSPAFPAIVTYLAVFHAWHTCESDGDHIHVIERANNGWRIGAEIPETETGGYRVRDHVLNAAIDVPKQFVTVADQVRVEAISAPLLPVCLLRLSEDFRVKTFSITGQALPFQQAGGVIAFVPPSLGARNGASNADGDRQNNASNTGANAANNVFTVSMTYAGHVNHQGSDYILANEATLDSYWYPHIARLPATSTVTATAPPGWLAIAQGEKKQERQNPDGSTTVTYRNDVPNSFFTLDIGRYDVTRRTVNGRVLSTYLLTPNPKRAEQCLDLLAQSLAYFDSHFAPFPYTHYEVVETKGPFGGALEAYSFATFGPGTLPGTIVHELSHTWWGGIVPCAYTRSMWNEGFAEYSSGLFSRASRRAEEPLEGVEEAPEIGKRRKFGNAFDAVSLADAHDTSDGHDEAVGYGKGALVMRALEAQIGQETMLRCLQTFVKDHPRGQAAEWPEFAQAVAKTTGQDLGWFFAQWIGRVGLPRVRLENVTSRPEAQGFVVRGEIVQEGDPYRLRLPLVLKTQAGKPLRQTLDVDGPRTPFELHTSSVPTRLNLDPDNLLPLATTTEQATFQF